MTDIELYTRKDVELQNSTYPNTDPNATTRHIKIGDTFYFVTSTILHKLQNDILRAKGHEAPYEETPYTVCVETDQHGNAGGQVITSLPSLDYEEALICLLNRINGIPDMNEPEPVTEEEDAKAIGVIKAGFDAQEIPTKTAPRKGK